MSIPLLAVKDLNVEFASRAGPVRILRDLSFAVEPGETVAIVGESGSGKSMTALAIIGLPPPKVRIVSGSISLDGLELVDAATSTLKGVRGDRISMIFQDPMTALNPLFPVGEQIAEVLRVHRGLSRREAMAKALEALRAVELPDAERRLRQYPHELSGGMRQRVMIAMAIACEPRLLIADEPTTALDVTVQAQVFDLLRKLQQRTGMSLILITHDMGAVAELADRAVVMYAGRSVESGRVERLVEAPRHPYSRGLINCIPDMDVDPDVPLVEIPGVVPALADIGPGCAFADRCAVVRQECRTTLPPIVNYDHGHAVACWNV